jgi:hypothetical protein
MMMTWKSLTAAFSAIALSAVIGTVRAEADKEAELNEAAEQYNAQVEKERDQVVCKWVSKTGSRIKEKQCRTKAQIKREADEARQYATKPKQSYKSE